MHHAFFDISTNLSSPPPPRANGTCIYYREDLIHIIKSPVKIRDLARRHFAIL